jgi:hypothetical protein
MTPSWQKVSNHFNHFSTDKIFIGDKICPQSIPFFYSGPQLNMCVNICNKTTIQKLHFYEKPSEKLLAFVFFVNRAEGSQSFDTNVETKFFFEN